MESKSKSQGTLTVNAVLHAQHKGQELPPARAYLFDRSGQLVDSKPVGKEAVSFPIASDQPYQVVVGPDLLAGGEKPTPADLMAQISKANAVRKDYIPQLKQSVIDFPIYHNIFVCWWQTCILVHGTVRKLLNPGSGSPQYAPICSGIVQIFQVDLGCTLDQLASFSVVTLRDSLVNALRGIRAVNEAAIIRGPVLPDPPPDRFLAQKLRTRSFQMKALSTEKTATATAQVRSAASASAKAAQSTLSHAEVATTLAALDGVALKNFIVAQKLVLWPFLCQFIPDYLFCWQELGEVFIQSDGSFSAEICFWCPADFPDLYFEVVQTIGGVTREISDPQIACSTYYDYDGSQSVDIVVDDPSALACIPDPGDPLGTGDLYVWPMSIGNVDLKFITDLENGAHTSTTGLLNGSAPWGGTLALKMFFDPRLKAISNIRYYRWSYQFEGDSGWTPIDATVTHRYALVTYSPFDLNPHPVTLGPFTVNGVHNLFTVPDPNPGDGWIQMNDPWDVPFAYFDSTDNHLFPFSYTDALPRRTGLVTLLLEMFDNNGVLVPCNNLGGAGPFKYVLPDFVHPGHYTATLTSNNITASGQLMFRVRVDNNDTVADLTGVKANGLFADPCGMLHYPNNTVPVDIYYVATHPNNFLTWSMSVWRGTSGVVASTSGATSSPPSPMPPFSNLASKLLGGCANAAFAVNLDTYATATDGYSNQNQYNRHDTIAFALITP